MSANFEDLVRRLGATVRAAELYSPTHPLVQRTATGLHGVLAPMLDGTQTVIVGFQADQPGYGAAGVLDDLRRERPGVIALQRHDWDPDGPDSATYFMSQKHLRDWLEREYRYAGELRYYALWERLTP